MQLHGLTWQNPRGYDPLVAASKAWRKLHPDTQVEWEALPWIDFEHRLLASFAGEAKPYDLVMLDHPWVGTLVSQGYLVPWAELADEGYLGELARRVVPPSFDSYVWEGDLWALPVDAACHAGLVRRDLADSRALPGDWQDLKAWASSHRSADTFPLVLSISSVLGHCLFLALMQAQGTPPYLDSVNPRCDPQAAAHVLETIVELQGFTPPGSQHWGPWDIFTHMTSKDDIGYCPQIFGYVNYFDAESRRRLQIVPCPAFEGRDAAPILGGVGLAVSRRSEHQREAADYARFVMSEATQREIFPGHNGQPATASAWSDETLDASVDHFYSALLPEMQRSFVRPRYAGFHDIELKNAAVLQRLWDGEASITETVQALNSPCA